MELTYVPVEKVHTFGSLPYYFWVVKILARCQQPGYLHHFGNRLLAVLSETNSNAWSGMKKKAIRNHQGSERSIMLLLYACMRYTWYSYVKYKQ